MYRETKFVRDLKEAIKDNFFATRHQLEVIKENEEEFDFYITKNEKRKVKFAIEYREKNIHIENISSKVTGDPTYVLDIIDLVIKTIEQLKKEDLIEIITIYRHLNLFTTMQKAVKAEKVEEFLNERGYEKATEIEEEMWMRFIDNPTSIMENWIKYIDKGSFYYHKAFFDSIENVLKRIESERKRFSYERQVTTYEDAISYTDGEKEERIEIIKKEHMMEIRHQGKKVGAYDIYEVTSDELEELFRKIINKDNAEEKRASEGLLEPPPLGLSVDTWKAIYEKLSGAYTKDEIRDAFGDESRVKKEVVKDTTYTVVHVKDHFVTIQDRDGYIYHSIFYKKQKELVTAQFRRVLEQEMNDILENNRMFLNDF